MLNLVNTQDAIIAVLRAGLNIPVHEQAIPDALTVKKVNGQVMPYAALQFGDLQECAGGKTFTGARDYDYELPINIQVIAAEPEVARKLASGAVLSTMLGATFPWTGEVRKRIRGQMYPITSSNGATEAYMFPSSWGVVIQMTEV